jgi:hypothetical protein
MKAKGAVAAVAAALAMGALAMGALVVAPPAQADGCGSAVVWGNGGGQCDGPYYPDGSFQRCVSVYVLGIGGSNCFIVPPPPPP